jgi:hypothetical protein
MADYDADLLWIIAPPDPTGDATALANASFETPDEYGGGADPVEDFPKDWSALSAAIGWRSGQFGSPSRWAETFDGQWDDNQDALDAFDAGDLTQGTFGTWPREYAYEGFQADWGDNQDALDAFGTGDLTAGEFDAAADEVEDLEEEWYSRHAIADTASSIAASWPTFGVLASMAGRPTRRTRSSPQTLPISQPRSPLLRRCGTTRSGITSSTAERFGTALTRRPRCRS